MISPSKELFDIMFVFIHAVLPLVLAQDKILQLTCYYQRGYRHRPEWPPRLGSGSICQCSTCSWRPAWCVWMTAAEWRSTGRPCWFSASSPTSAQWGVCWWHLTEPEYQTVPTRSKHSESSQLLYHAKPQNFQCGSIINEAVSFWHSTKLSLEANAN